MSAKDMKRVIFVGGTEFSGSTFFHMILANDPAGFAVGEAHNYLRPSRPHHFDMRCSCGEQPCRIWQEITAVGEANLYQSLFERFPEVEFIVDSSKNPFWIKDQVAILGRQGIAAQHILMWKTPLEFAHSYNKRGNPDAWQSSWVSYHRLYRSFFEQWRTIRYADFANNRPALLAVCSYLRIPCFPDKEKYWHKTHHVIGGNPSARVHLYENSSRQYQENVQRSSSKIEVSEKGVHQSIYYESEHDADLHARVQSQIDKNPHVAPIIDMLEARDIAHSSDHSQSGGSLILSYPMIQLRRVKYWFVRRAAALRYGSA
jgi:hypothetical protein